MGKNEATEGETPHTGTFPSPCRSAQADMSAFGGQLLKKMAVLEKAAKDANHRYLAEQKDRRELYNKLQEARGNIRVICRIRPMLPKESDGGATAPAARPISKYELTLPEAPSDRQGGRMLEAKTFEFDRVFGPESSQEAVYEEVQPMVTSALDGYHSTVFAYGQTGEEDG
jgi:hypothetical protein